MKNLRTLLFVTIITLTSAVASAQKVAHIDAEKLIASMPETIALKAEMEKLGKTYKDDIAAMAKKLEDKFKKYNAEAEGQTQAENEKRALEVQQDRAKIGQAEKAAYEDLQKKQAEKLGPILKKAQDAIQAVAKEKGIAYVMDASAGKGLLVFESGVDLYNAVKAKLGF